MNKFEQFQNKDYEYTHIKYKDLYGLNILSKYCENYVISGAGHDIIFININDDTLETISEEEIKELIYCGFLYDSYYGGLVKYV